MELLQIQMILHNEIRLILSVTSKRNLLKLSPQDLVTNLNKLIIFVKVLYKINLLSNQDIYPKSIIAYYLRKFALSGLGCRLNPRGVLDFSPLYFFSKRKIALQGY